VKKIENSNQPIGQFSGIMIVAAVGASNRNRRAANWQQLYVGADSNGNSTVVT